MDGADTLKKIAFEITKKLRNSTTVDWQKREGVCVKIRILVWYTLRRYKYPLDKQKTAMEQEGEGMADLGTR